DYVTFGIILDDLERADGVSRRGLLGGGGPQTAFAMRLWSESVGMVARVGADLPGTVWAWLGGSGGDAQGGRGADWPAPRAVQRTDSDGRRSQQWLVPPEVVAAQLRRALGDLPDSYRGARGLHLGVHPEAPDWDWLAGLRALGGVVSIETFRPAAKLPDRAE